MSELVERGRELALIAEALRRTAKGAGSVVAITGASGVGKTRLLARSRELATKNGFLVLSASGSEYEQDYAHGIVRQLLERRLERATPNERARLLAGAAGLSAPVFASAINTAALDTQPAAVGLDHGLYWLIANLADQGPLMVAVDDVHWADPQSVRFLIHLASRLDGLPIFLAVAVRSCQPGLGEVMTMLSRLLRRATTVPVLPLTLQGSGAALAQLLEAPSRNLIEACFSVTGGNPFLLRELALELRSLGHTSPTVADVDQVVPRAVRDAILMRLNSLPSSCLDLAQALAVLGDGANLRHVAALADVDPAVALGAVDSLAAAEIWTLEQPPRFVHPLVRQAVHTNLSAEHRARLHERSATVLQADGIVDAERIATHLAAVTPAARPETVDVLCRAAAEARDRGAIGSAVRWFRRALSEPPLPALRSEIAAQLGRCELLAGDPQQAVRDIRTAIELATPTGRAHHGLMLARALIATGQIDSGLHALEEGLRAAGAVDRELELAYEGELALSAHMYAQIPEHIHTRLDRAKHYLGATPGERLVLANLSHTEQSRGSSTAVEIADIARRALGDGALVRDLTGDHISTYLPAVCLLAADQPHESAAACGVAAAEATKRGSAAGVAFANSVWAFALYTHGDILTAETHARTAWDAIAQVDPDLGLGVLATMAAALHLSLSLVEVGDLGRAEEAIRIALDRGRRNKIAPELLAHVMRGRAVLHTAFGRWTRARADLDQVHQDLAAVGAWQPDVPWGRDLALVLAELGESSEAVAVAEQHLAGARRWNAASAIGAALRVRALVEPAGPKLSLLDEAADILETASNRLEHARALVDLGIAYRAADRPTAGVDLLRRGLDLAARCGARVLEQRALTELRRAGAKPRRVSTTGLSALTASQRRVAQLASSGRSNREIAQELFITTKTVESHLAASYRKLGLQGRDQLAAAFMAEGKSPSHDACRLCLAVR